MAAVTLPPPRWHQARAGGLGRPQDGGAARPLIDIAIAVMVVYGLSAHLSDRRLRHLIAKSSPARAGRLDGAPWTTMTGE